MLFDFNWYTGVMPRERALPGGELIINETGRLFIRTTSGESVEVPRKSERKDRGVLSRLAQALNTLAPLQQEAFVLDGEEDGVHFAQLQQQGGMGKEGIRHSEEEYLSAIAVCMKKGMTAEEIARSVIETNPLVQKATAFGDTSTESTDTQIGRLADSIRKRFPGNSPRRRRKR